MTEQRKASNQATAKVWRNAWSNKKYRVKTITGTIFLAIILATLPFFFSIIEQRQGIFLNDRLLQFIPSVDVSVPTFLIIWSMVVYLLYRCSQDPVLFIHFMWAFNILCISRMISIGLVPLEPPTGLIPLKDPISSIFYGGTQVFIKKDLFYSGHTSIQFLIFLSLRNRIEKIVSLLATLSIASFVLIQHVHYTIDVIAALVFTYIIYRIGKWIAEF